MAFGINRKNYELAKSGLGALGRGITSGTRQVIGGVDELSGMIKRRSLEPAPPERRSIDSIRNRTDQRQVPLSIATIEQQLRKVQRQMQDPQLSQNAGAMAQLKQEMEYLNMRKLEMMRAQQGYGARQPQPQPQPQQPVGDGGDLSRAENYGLQGSMPEVDQDMVRQLGRQTDPRLIDEGYDPYL